MDPITADDTSTTEDFDALVNIQAELDRLDSLKSRLPSSTDDATSIVDHQSRGGGGGDGDGEMVVVEEGEEQTEIVVHEQIEVHDEQQQLLQQHHHEHDHGTLASIIEPISTSFLTASSMGVLNVVNADGMSYEIIEPIDCDQADQTLTHFLDDDTIASTSEVTIGDSSQLEHVGDESESVDDHALQYGIPEVASAMSLGATYETEAECVDDGLAVALATHDNPVASVVGTVETFPALSGSSAFTFLSSTVPALAPVMSTGRPAIAVDSVKTEPLMTIGTHELTAISDESTVAASPMTFTTVKTVTVAPSSILDRTTTASTTTAATATAVTTKISRPIYLIPNSTVSLAMTTFAPTVVTTKSTSEAALLNKVVFTATNPLAGAGLKVQPSSRSLSAIQSRVVPTVVRAGHGHVSSTQITVAASPVAVASATTAGSNNQVFTKMIFANNAGSGQVTGMTLSPGQANAIFSGLPQPVKIVTAAQAQALVGQNKAISLGQQACLTSPIKQQQLLTTSLPGSPSKQTFMLGKYALSPKTPTTITMIPVTTSKPPLKIALPGTSTAPRVGSILSTMPTTTTTTTASASPKFIIKPVGSTLAMKPGTVLSTVSTTPSNSGTVPASLVDSGGTIKKITIPTSMVTALNSSSTTNHPMQGNKVSYIRLVQAPSPATGIVATTNVSVAATSTVGVKSHQLIGSIVSTANRPIAAVTTTTSAAGRLQQPSSSGNQSIAPQVKIAVPIAPAGHTLKAVGGQQRILIPASAMSSLAQLRPTGGVSGSSCAITLPANALAHLPPGTTFFPPGSNIMMVPAQYVAQFQQQHAGHKQPTAVIVSSASAVAVATAAAQPSSSSAAAVSLVSQASTPVFAPQHVAISVAAMAGGSGGGVLKHHIMPSTVAASGATPSLFTLMNERSHSKHQVNGRPSQDSNGVRPRKPCNCTKSQCLKLYCDCFANGEFCHDCNCNNCFNNLEHEEERQKAIKSCLERNPQAFHPKIDISFATKAKDGDIERRHNKGCNCKRSGCLKNYCECYEAKIMCSYMCKCVGCKNVEETADKKTLMHLADAAEVRVQQQTAARNKLSSQMMDAATAAAACSQNLGPTTGDKVFSSFITTDVVEATCQCLLAQADEGRRQNQSDVVVEQLVVQEFGRCLQQIIEYASKTKP